MKNQTNRKHSRRDGVALIIVLGLLSVITLLAVAFAIAMRIERLAARNHVNAARAEHLIQVAFVRATEDINEWFLDQPNGAVYADWDALGSKNSGAAGPSTKTCNDLLTGSATNVVPQALLDRARGKTATWDWIIPRAQDWPKNQPFGRVAYLAMNASGFLDANYVGGPLERTGSTNVNELSLENLSEMVSEQNFFDDRKDYVRYESLTELGSLNRGIQPPISNLFVYSYDFDHDVFFEDKNTVGEDDAALDFKFNVNSITNFDCFKNGKDKRNDLYKYRDDPKFDTEYWQKLVDLLTVAKLERPTDVAWNFINWLDADRVPQSKDQDPWAHTEGGEAIPLINEIALMELGGDKDSGYNYQFRVELWFPFTGPAYAYHPVVVVPEDQFYLQIAVWYQDPGAKYARNHVDLQNQSSPDRFFEYKIENMEYGTAANTEFLVFPPDNLVGDMQHSVHIDKKVNETPLWFITRVVVKTESQPVPVEQASGPGAGGQYHPHSFTAPGFWSVDDPRSNGKTGDFKAAPDTLGRMNDTSATDAWSFDGADNRRQGVPIFAKDGLMRTIGEVGYIYRSNIKPGRPGEWDTIDLMHTDKGAYLLDHMTTKETPKSKDTTEGKQRLARGKPTKGLVSINTTQREVLETLFQDVKIGYTDPVRNLKEAPLAPEDIDIIVDAILDKRERGGYPFISFQDMFANNGGSALPHGGSIAAAFRKAAKQAWERENSDSKTAAHDRVLEDAFRQIIDMITFRQNIFVIVCAAQALAPPEPGQTTGAVVGEKRAVATIYRDAYTGRTFTRSFRWLTDDEE